MGGAGLHACMLDSWCMLDGSVFTMGGTAGYEYSDPFRNSECYHDTHWDLSHPTLLSDTV